MDGQCFSALLCGPCCYRNIVPYEPLIDVGERSGQLRPYVRPVARHLPLAIMGVRMRVRHQSAGRARGTRVSTVLPELFLTTAFPITRFSVCCRISRAYTRCPPSCARTSHCRFRCGRNTSFRPVDLLMRHQRPCDARHLVRESNRYWPAERPRRRGFANAGCTSWNASLPTGWCCNGARSTRADRSPATRSACEQDRVAALNPACPNFLLDLGQRLQFPQ